MTPTGTPKNGTAATQRWIIGLAVVVIIAQIGGFISHVTYGGHVENDAAADVAALTARINGIEILLTEVRSDVKTLLRERKP